MARADDRPDRPPRRALIRAKLGLTPAAAAARQGARGRHLGRRPADRPRAAAGRRPAAAAGERRHPVLMRAAGAGRRTPTGACTRRKRWLAAAVLQADGRYPAAADRARSARSTSFWRSLEATGGAPVLLGFDFPIGLPARLRRARRYRRFRHGRCRSFGEGDWARSTTSPSAPDEIGLGRPFYPARPGGRRRQQLLDGLGLDDWSDLLRRCDRATADPARGLRAVLDARRQPGRQGGDRRLARSAGAGAARRPRPRALAVPGPLDELLARHRFVVAETYPAEVYGHLGLDAAAPWRQAQPGGAARQAPRACSPGRRLPASTLDPAARAEIEDGFGAGAIGEDRFDAVVGLLGMLNVVLGRRASGEPDDPVVRRIEGWILGQTAA